MSESRFTFFYKHLSPQIVLFSVYGYLISITRLTNFYSINGFFEQRTYNLLIEPYQAFVEQMFKDPLYKYYLINGRPLNEYLLH